MKRSIGNLIAIVLLATILVACGSNAAKIAQVPVEITQAQQNPMPILVIGPDTDHPAEFDEPKAVTMDKDGNIYVYDGAIRIQMFDATGTLVRTIGEAGSDPGLYRSVKDLVVGPDGQLYITDPVTCVVTVYGKDGKFVKTIGGRGKEDGQFTDMHGITFNSKGELIVSGGEMGIVQIFDKKGNFLRKFGEPGEGEGQFVEAKWIAADSQNRMYVVDTERGKILLFNADGTFIREIGERGKEPGQFKGDIEAVAVDAFDRLYVVDQDGSKIAIFDEDGAFLATLGEPGEDIGKINKPQGLAIDLVHGYLIDTEENGNRLQLFNLADLK